MIRWTLLFAVVMLAGCAGTFGHRNEQTLIKVSTAPPRLNYYVLLWSEAKPFLQATPTGISVKNPDEFENFLNGQLQALISNTSPLTYTVGSYVLAVRCPNGFRFQHFDARPGTTNPVTLECL